ncbi:hypothetical protein TNCV_4531731 [Trichonephila clavipes]|nr:hypothetical protein TNCV_4531731 [Trichonephila clavipes]
MWTPQQKVQCVLWLTELKQVTRVPRSVRTEWSVDPPTSKSILQWKRTLKEMLTLVSQVDKEGKKSFLLVLLRMMGRGTDPSEFDRKQIVMVRRLGTVSAKLIDCAKSHSWTTYCKSRRLAIHRSQVPGSDWSRYKDGTSRRITSWRLS